MISLEAYVFELVAAASPLKLGQATGSRNHKRASSWDRVHVR